MKTIVMGLATGLVMLGLVACGGDDKKSGGGDAADNGGGSGGASSDKTPYDAAAAKGSVSGTVKLDGTRPEQVKLNVSSDEVCAGAWADKDAWDQKFWVNEDMTLPNVFVWAHKGPHKEMSGYEIPSGFKLVQEGCYYKPHVFGVMVGQAFDVVNSDATTHNVHVKAKRNEPFNEAQEAGASDTITMDKREGRIPFSCDVHSWMSAWAFASEHPFFATTDASGAYSIAGLPDGEYEMKAWHEKFGEKSFKVTIAGDAVTSDVTLPQ